MSIEERKKLPAQQDSTGSISGKVTEAGTKTPLERANVWLSGLLIGTTTDAEGKFVLKRLQAGTYTLEISFVGYRRAIVRDVPAQPGRTTELELALEPEPVKLSEIVVSPGTYSLSNSMTTELQFSKSELRVMPMGVDDPLRTLQLLPGTNTDNMNAKIGIRGSRPDDALYVIDGMEIYGTLFHLDRIQAARSSHMNGLISILNTDIIDNLYVSLGGFPSKYGNKSGGVIGLTTVSPDVDGLHGSLSLNIAKMGAVLTGRNGDDSFVFSAQRGYFDLVFGLLGAKSSIWPYYYDLFGKYEHKFSSGKLFFEAVHAKDWIELAIDSLKAGGTVDVQYSLNYVWAGLEWFVTPSLASTTTLYTSFLPEKSSYEFQASVEPDFSRFEKRATLGGIKQDILYEFSKTSLLEAGLNLRLARSRYSFFQTYEETIGDTVNIVRSEPTYEGYDFGAYTSFRTKLLNGALIVDAGLRFDHQSYISTDDKQWSPRIGLALHLPYETTLRAGTGLYYQPTDLANISNYNPLAFRLSRSSHYLVSVENKLLPRSEVRIEAYYKRMSPERKSMLVGGSVLPFEYGYAKGVDMFLKKQYDWWYFWIGYSYGLAKDVAGTQEVYRSLDRRTSFSLNVNLAAGYGWNFNLSYRYATARPFTKRYFEKVATDSISHWKSRYGMLNGERGSIFSQLNLSVSRRTQFSWGWISWQLQFLNLLDRKGVVAQDTYLLKNQWGQVYPTIISSSDFPFLITFGITWEF